MSNLCQEVKKSQF